MKIPELIEALQSNKIPTKAVKQAIIKELYPLLEPEGKKPVNSKRPASYMNATEQKKYAFCHAVRTQGRLFAKEEARLGHEEIAGFMLLGANAFDLAMNRRQQYMDKKALDTANRAIDNLKMTIEAVDIKRFRPEKMDDEQVTVLTDSLYELARLAMNGGCNKDCDGNKDDCGIRDLMVEMRIPIATGYDRKCPYWCEEQGEISEIGIKLAVEQARKVIA